MWSAVPKVESLLSKNRFRGFLRQTNNMFEIDWECPLCLQTRDNHACFMWKCRHSVCMSCFQELADSKKRICVICKTQDDTFVPRRNDRKALFRHLRNLLVPNHAFFWIKINDEVFFIEKYPTEYAQENGVAVITISNYTSEENIYFNSETWEEFFTQFKDFIRNLTGIVMVQTGLGFHEHLEQDDIVALDDNEWALTEGLSNTAVYRI